MLGKLEVDGGGEVSSFSDPNERNLVSEVSITEPRVFGEGNPIKVWLRVVFEGLMGRFCAGLANVRKCNSHNNISTKRTGEATSFLGHFFRYSPRCAVFIL